MLFQEIKVIQSNLSQKKLNTFVRLFTSLNWSTAFLSSFSGSDEDSEEKQDSEKPIV